ncbi:hypothetical protein D3C75_842900 [compost metagenome]
MLAVIAHGVHAKPIGVKIAGCVMLCARKAVTVTPAGEHGAEVRATGNGGGQLAECSAYRFASCSGF